MINKLRFPKHLRLTTKIDFQTLFDKPYKATQRFLLVLYRLNQKSHARLGMVIGKRIVNEATERNRIRRIVRESFRHHQEKLQGFDLIVIARSQCHTLNNHQLREGIENLWEKLLTQHRNSLR